MINEDDLKLVIAKEEYKIGKKQLQNFEKPKSNFFQKWGIAASIVICLSLALYWIFDNQIVNSKKLYASYFTDYPNIITPVSRNTDELSETALVFENYTQKKYNEALVGFEKLLNDNTLNEREAIHLYQAICFLRLKKPVKAIELLRNETVSYRLKDKYLWYLAMAYLQYDKVNEAQKQLKLLSNLENNFKKQETLSLLESLE